MSALQSDSHVVVRPDIEQFRCGVGAAWAIGAAKVVAASAPAHNSGRRGKGKCIVVLLDLGPPRGLSMCKADLRL
jgi:hypothetical protein